MTDLNWCICGKATMEDALYCSLRCKTADCKSMTPDSCPVKQIEPFFSLPSPAILSPTSPWKPAAAAAVPTQNTFIFHSGGSHSTQAASTHFLKRPRMNSVETPPTSPVLKHVLNEHEMASAEFLYAQLAFNRRSKRGVA